LVVAVVVVHLQPLHQAWGARRCSVAAEVGPVDITAQPQPLLPAVLVVLLGLMWRVAVGQLAQTARHPRQDLQAQTATAREVARVAVEAAQL
jgi:hypothetical protein